jgi:Icc-related predicted phosphoesterase
VRLEGIPAEFGWWGWSRECEENSLRRELHDQLREAPRPRIYLSHVPPYGCMDKSAGGQHIGHRPLADRLAERGWPNSLVLCGHVHSDFGWIRLGQTLIVNAACGYALIDWNPKGAKVLNLARMEPRCPSPPVAGGSVRLT